MNNKLINNMSYETFNKIMKGNEIYLLTQPFINILAHNEIVGIGLCGIDILALIVLLNKEKLKEETKEIVQIKELYNEFLKEYSKINKILELKDPNEICTAYNFALYNGFLSQGKSFRFGSDKVLDYIPKVAGANIMTGNSVCRHIAPALRDIYHMEDIESVSLFAYLSHESLLYNTLYDTEMNQTLLKDFVTYIGSGQTVEEALINTLKEKLQDVDSYLDYERRKKLNTNHVITLAIKDNKKYILDPTQKETTLYISNPSKDNNYISNDGCILQISNNKREIKNYNNIKGKYDIDSKLSLETNPHSDSIKKVEQTKQICEKNIYLFDRFYNEHHEIYEEVTSLINIVSQNNKTKKLTLK